MKMKSVLKKMLCCFAAMTCFMALAGAGIPNQPLVSNQKPQPTGAPSFHGTAQIMSDSRIGLENDDTNGKIPEMVLNITKDTLILNAVSGMPVPLSEIREGETLYAYTSQIMTMSLPPITNAELILCKIPADFGVPTYAEIEKVEKVKDDQLRITTDQNIIFNVSKDTVLFPYLTKNIIGMDSLVPGTKVLAWYNIVLTSEPPQASPTKMMAFAYGYTGWAEASKTGLQVNGEAVKLSQKQMPYMEGETLMVPLKPFAESLDCKVAWNGKTKGITVSKNGGTLYTFTAEGTKVTKDEKAVLLKKASDVRSGVTFMALEDLETLHKVKTVK